jgi:16S rRNA (guanine966-N2)-methyltransferase
MRIVGGKFAYRDLVGPSDFRVRPTAEHVRAGLLDLLADDLKDASVCDLFAGTGALGLEAISRGAKRCDFVETRPSSLAALKSNIIQLKLRERTRVFKKDALPFATQLNEHAYDLVFCDPPYESRMLDRVIEAWQARRFTPVLAVEHATKHKLPPGAVSRTFDDSSITIYRL